MFNKLKLKLTLFNMLTVGLIILAITAIIFWDSPYSNATDVTNKMWELALQGPEQNQETSLVRRHVAQRRRSLIYVQLTPQNEILHFYSFVPNMDPKLIKELVDKATSSSDYSGKITSEAGDIYPFVKVAYDPTQGTVVVFRDPHSAKAELVAFAFELIAIIIISVFLVFVGSLFLSSKSLVPIRNAWKKQLDFSADASHELRTPIAAIQTNAELILLNKEETVASQEKWLKNILNETSRMAKLVEDLLLISRTDSGQLQLIKTSFLLDEAIKEAAQPLEATAAQHHITLCLKLTPQTYFNGDIQRMKQLIIILVDNAIKYMNRAGSITITLKPASHKLQLIVADTGEGIPKESLPYLFDRFFRADKSRTSSCGGSGLGLSIAKCIVTEHNGSITAKSTLGEGTQFIITLPLT